jgi:HD superfamily phosphodiesterase
VTNTVETLRSLDMPVPNSAVARRARELIEESEPAFLVNHSIRSYAWAVALAPVDQLLFDPEVLYVAALLHDIGLVPAYDTGGCFEIEGAKYAEQVALEAGLADEPARAIRDAIALHMASLVPPEARAESFLLSDSTGVDVRGRRLDVIPSTLVPRVIEAFPRLEFKREFSRLFVDQAERKPRCRAAEMVAAGMLPQIASAPFSE